MDDTVTDCRHRFQPELEQQCRKSQFPLNYCFRCGSSDWTRTCYDICIENERQSLMEKTRKSNNATVSAQPRLHQNAPEIQPYGTVSYVLPLELEEPVRKRGS